jgi:hypothetical protein
LVKPTCSAHENLSCGFKYHEALSLSMSEALWLHWAAQEDEGGVRIVSDSDRVLLAEADRIKADPAAYEAMVAQFAHVTGAAPGRASDG